MSKDDSVTDINHMYVLFPLVPSELRVECCHLADESIVLNPGRILNAMGSGCAAKMNARFGFN